MRRHPILSRPAAAAICALATAALAATAVLAPSTAAATDAFAPSGPHYDNPRHDPDARGWRYGYTSQPAILRPREIEQILCDQGWTDPHSIKFDRRHGVYTAYAYGRGGRPFVLTVNAHSGRVLDAEALGRRRGHPHPGW